MVFATGQGSTKGIAERIVDRLRSRGLDIEIREASALEDVSFDAAVAGSPIHSGKWLPEASRAMTRLEQELHGRPLWLFSVSTLGETSSVFPGLVARLLRRMRKETEEIAGLRTRFDVRDHRNFGGVITRDSWGRAGDIFLRAFGGRYTDCRDWADIDAWADRIADALLAGQ